MLEINVNYKIAVKENNFFIHLLPTFQKDYIACSDFNYAFNNVYERALIFSKMVYQIRAKMLEMNVQYRIAVKTSYYLIDSPLVFQK